jgi:hypothetical protein
MVGIKYFDQVRALEDMGPGTEISMTYLGLYKTTEERKVRLVAGLDRLEKLIGHSECGQHL